MDVDFSFPSASFFLILFGSVLLLEAENEQIF